MPQFRKRNDTDPIEIRLQALDLGTMKGGHSIFVQNEVRRVQPSPSNDLTIVEWSSSPNWSLGIVSGVVLHDAGFSDDVYYERVISQGGEILDAITGENPKQQKCTKREEGIYSAPPEQILLV